MQQRGSISLPAQQMIIVIGPVTSREAVESGLDVRKLHQALSLESERLRRPSIVSRHTISMGPRFSRMKDPSMFRNSQSLPLIDMYNTSAFASVCPFSSSISTRTKCFRPSTFAIQDLTRTVAGVGTGLK